MILGDWLFRPARDHDSFPVDRPWNNRCSSETKGATRLVKSGILDPRDLTPIYQRHRADHHRLLRSGGDDDLVRMTARASVITQIGCDRLAQIGVAAARRVLE